MVEVCLENGEKAAPTYCCTAVEQYGLVDLVVAGVVSDERGKSTSTSTVLSYPWDGMPVGCPWAVLALPVGCSWAVRRLPVGCPWAVWGTVHGQQSVCFPW